MKNEVVIVSACRTPIGNFGGAFLGTSAANLGKVVIAEAIKRAGIPIRPFVETARIIPTIQNRVTIFGSGNPFF